MADEIPDDSVVQQPSGANDDPTPAAQPLETAAPGFAAGTLIRVARGDVAVEDLAIGDVVVTTSGAHRPIRRLDHRAVDGRRQRRPSGCWPVRITAHAFGENRPAHDLFVSPGHSLCVDVLGEVLIPALALVNGATVQQVEVEQVTYWHVGLDHHDVILAENLGTESCLDIADPGRLRDHGVAVLDTGPASRANGGLCRPFHDGGPVAAGVKAQLRKRAAKLGWVLSDRLELHLEIDGLRHAPVVRGATARFHVPAGARALSLVSPTTRPCDVIQGTEDARELGLCLGGLAIDDGFGAEHPIAIDDPRLADGLHEVEDGCRRWTDGRTPLPADFTGAHPDGFFLRIELAGPPLPRWVAPVALEPPGARLRLVSGT